MAAAHRISASWHDGGSAKQAGGKIVKNNRAAASNDCTYIINLL